MIIAMLIVAALLCSILLFARWRESQRRERRHARKLRQMERDKRWTEMLSQNRGD